MANQLSNGIVQFRSAFDVPTTLGRIRHALESKGVKIFAHIDFSGDAAQVGMTLRNEQMLIFGNPKGGTPLMQVEPLVGLDLPLKALVWEDEHGATWVAFNASEYLLARHHLPEALAGNLAPALDVVREAAGS